MRYFCCQIFLSFQEKPEIWIWVCKKPLCGPNKIVQWALWVPVFALSTIDRSKAIVPSWFDLWGKGISLLGMLACHAPVAVSDAGLVAGGVSSRMKMRQSPHGPEAGPFPTWQSGGGRTPVGVQVQSHHTWSLRRTDGERLRKVASSSSKHENMSTWSTWWKLNGVQWSEMKLIVKYSKIYWKWSQVYISAKFWTSSAAQLCPLFLSLILEGSSTLVIMSLSVRRQNKNLHSAV